MLTVAVTALSMVSIATEAGAKEASARVVQELNPSQMTFGPPQVHYPLEADKNLPASNNITPVITSGDITLRGGETRLIRDDLELTISSDEGAEMDNQIRCIDHTPGSSTFGHQVNTSAYTGRNHEGSSAGVMRLMESLLFTAPHDGTYECQALTLTTDGDRTDYYMTVLAGSELSMSSADEAGSHWWQDGTCEPAGTDPNCRYLGASGDPTIQDVFSNGPAHGYVWTAPNNATVASVTSTIMVTSCPYGTGSCPQQHWGSNGFLGIGKPDKAVIETHLEFNQLDAAGQVCAAHSTPNVRYEIKNAVHHFPINYDLPSVQISQTCGGSRNFVLHVIVSRISDNPVKLDGSDDSGSTSNASVTNTIYDTPLAVPNVVGSSETDARSALQGAGLAVGEISRLVDSHPVGTVIGQNSPGSTIEPAGSPVNITVSSGLIAEGFPIFTSTAANKCIQVGPADNPLSNNARTQQGDCTPSNVQSQQEWRANAYGVVTTTSGKTTVYQIQNVLSGMCMEVRSADANAYVHADMDQTYCGSGPVSSIDGQLWVVTPVSTAQGTKYKLSPWSALSRGSSMCVDVTNASSSSGTWITQYFCNGTNAQLFNGVGLDRRQQF